MDTKSVFIAAITLYRADIYERLISDPDLQDQDRPALNVAFQQLDNHYKHIINHVHDFGLDTKIPLPPDGERSDIIMYARQLWTQSQ